MSDKVHNSGSFIVSYVISNDEDTAVMLIGTQKSGVVKVINAFVGKQAIEIYHKLKGINK